MANRGISDLPQELWEEIYNKMDFQSKVRARSVCRRWRDISDKSFIKINTIFIKVSEGDQSSDDFQLYGYRYDPITSCDIYLPDLINRSANRDTIQTNITTIMAQFQQLIRVFICFGPEFTVNDDNNGPNICRFIVHKVIQNCPSDLNHLCLKSTSNWTQFRISDSHVLVAKLPNLRLLKIPSNGVIIDGQTVSQLITHLPHLEVLILPDPRPMRAFFYGDPLLQQINANIRVIYTSGSILNQVLAAGPLSRLHELRVKHFEGQYMPGIIQNFQFLRELSLEICVVSYNRYYRSRIDNEFFSQIPLMTTLEKLSMSSCCGDGYPNDIGRLLVHKPTNPNKRTVSMCRLSLSLESIHAIGQYLASLKELDLDVSDSFSFTAEAIISLIAIANQRPNQFIKITVFNGLETEFLSMGIPVPNNMRLTFGPRPLYGAIED